MNDSKMHEVQIDVERKHITEDSEVRLYLSVLHEEQKEIAFLDLIIAYFINILCSSLVTIEFGRWITRLMEERRGYSAMGGEVFVILAVFAASFYIINYILDLYKAEGRK